MAVLKATYLYPSDRRNDPAHPVPREIPFSSDADAIERAIKILDKDLQRQRKDPRKPPALQSLFMLCNDGVTIGEDEIRRRARIIMD
jgi:hypothetical protein